jgi:hypothetical protein
MWSWVAAYWKPLCIVAALVVVGAQGYDMGASNVQQKWDAERAQIAEALAHNAEAQRDKEYALQQSMNEVQREATQRLEALRTDADSANASADRLRDQVGKLLAAADRMCPSARAGTSRQTAENPGNLLAVVLDKSIRRNQQLAEFADAAITAAQACEKARN